jgi:hypothetical protein
MTDEQYCAALQDWHRVQQVWKRPGEVAATEAAHASLDEFFQSTQKPEPPPEGAK